MKLFKKDLNKRTSRNQIMDRVRFLCKMFIPASLWESQRSIETKEPETETGREPVRARESHRKSQLEPEGTRMSLWQPERVSQGELTSSDSERETLFCRDTLKFAIFSENC